MHLLSASSVEKRLILASESIFNVVCIDLAHCFSFDQGLEHLLCGGGGGGGWGAIFVALNVVSVGSNVENSYF